MSKDQIKIFLVAGEHSGDALGAKLMSGLRSRSTRPLKFSGVGGSEMAGEGLNSLFPIEDVAVMGPLSILPRLPKIVRRVYQTVDAAVAERPDIVVIIDSPEFTHPIAKRIRKRMPFVPIVDYVCPSVWAWRPWRARKMRPYVDRVLALLPFEPDALQRLGGPPGTYVGHPLIERLDEIRSADAAGLASRLGIADGLPVLLILPGSRSSEVAHLIDDFGDAIARLSELGVQFHVVIPAVQHLRETIVARSGGWKVKPHVIDGASDKYAAMQLARAAMAASGTVTLELALAGTPMIAAYKSDAVTAYVVRRLLTTDTALLSNLVLGERAFPEFMQADCTAESLSQALVDIMRDGAARDRQLAALARVPGKVALPSGTPSTAAADVVLKVLEGQAAGKSRLAGPM